MRSFLRKLVNLWSDISGTWSILMPTALFAMIALLLLQACSQPTHNAHYLDMAMLGESSEVTLQTRTEK